MEEGLRSDRARTLHTEWLEILELLVLEDEAERPDAPRPPACNCQNFRSGGPAFHTTTAASAAIKISQSDSRCGQRSTRTCHASIQFVAPSRAEAMRASQCSVAAREARCTPSAS